MKRDGIWVTFGGAKGFVRTRAAKRRHRWMALFTASEEVTSIKPGRWLAHPMDDDDDFRAVVGGLIDGDVSPLDNQAGGGADLRTRRPNFRVGGNQIELIEKLLQQPVRCWLIVDGNIKPDIAHLALGTRR